MASIERLDTLLKVASKLLDAAASEISSVKLEPTRGHVRRIGTLVTGIFELQQAVWQLAPELKPAYLKDPPSDVGESGRLGDTLLAAVSLSDAGDRAGACRVLREYLETNPPAHLRMHAESELQRLERA